ncbi:hypothetical protein LXL04_029845 [Taraxacum kok-saghyz]
MAAKEIAAVFSATEGYRGLETPTEIRPLQHHFRPTKQEYLYYLTIVIPRFNSEEVSGQNQVKAFVQRKIRQSIADEYPGLELVMDDLLPKKSPFISKPSEFGSGEQYPPFFSIYVMGHIRLHYDSFINIQQNLSLLSCWC